MLDVGLVREPWLAKMHMGVDDSRQQQCAFGINDFYLGISGCYLFQLCGKRCVVALKHVGNAFALNEQCPPKAPALVGNLCVLD